MRMSTLQKARVLLQQTEDKSKVDVDAFVKSLVKHAVRTGKLKELSKLLESLKGIVRAQCGVQHVQVNHVAQDEKKLSKKLKDILGESSEITCKKDPSLIGGVIVTINGVRIDGSIATRLITLKDSLSHQ